MDVMLSPGAHRSAGDAMAARLREASLLVVACGVAGMLVGGIGSRLLAGGAGVGGGLTGTLFVGIASATLGVGAFTILRPWLPHGPFVRGLAFGGLLLPLLGASVFDPASADVALVEDPVGRVVLCSGLFLAFGLIASLTFAVLDARVSPAASLSPRAWALTLVGALPLIPAIVGLPAALAPRIGIPLLVAWAAAIAARSLARRRRHGPAHLVRIGATSALVVVVGLAGAASLDAARAIVAAG